MTIKTLKERYAEQGGIFDMVRIAKRETGLSYDIWANSFCEERVASSNTQYIIIKNAAENEISISFFGEPRIETGSEHINKFGVKNVNEVKKYLKKNRLLFVAHSNGEIYDTDLGNALRTMYKYPYIKPDKALEIIKGVTDGSLYMIGFNRLLKMYKAGELGVNAKGKLTYTPNTGDNAGVPAVCIESDGEPFMESDLQEHV